MPQKPDTPEPASDPPPKPRRTTDWASLALSGSGGGGSLQGVDGVHGVGRIQPLNLARTMVAGQSAGQGPAYEAPPSPHRSDASATQQEAEHLSHLAQVLERAEEIKGSEEAALAWLRTPHPALAGDAPAAWLKNDAGLAQVLQLLQQA